MNKKGTSSSLAITEYPGICTVHLDRKDCNEHGSELQVINLWPQRTMEGLEEFLNLPPE